MWRPVGPLPAAVYWRRRCVAVASTVAVVVLIVLSVAALVAPHGDGTTLHAARTALRDPVAPAPAPTPQVPITPSPTPPATTSDVLRPDETPTRPGPAATPVPVPPTGPVPCTDAMLAVRAGIDAPTYKVGDHPVLRLVITNTSGRPCVRDLDSARQEVVVWSGDQKVRLWSSNDCANGASTDLRTLVPGRPVAFAVTWLGRTSSPGCRKRRTVVPVGAYRVLTRLDDDISPPTPFLLS